MWRSANAQTSIQRSWNEDRGQALAARWCDYRVRYAQSHGHTILVTNHTGMRMTHFAA